MTLSDFQTRTHGKWILTGEHTVLRGSGAIVFPIPDKFLDLSYQASSGPLDILCPDSNNKVPEQMLANLLDEGCRLLKLSAPIKGQFIVENCIPVCQGMGASAALSVAVSRWFAHQGFIPKEDWYSFAKSLEHYFHGKSSGLDVAGVAHQQGIYFKNNAFHAIPKAWEPHWYLTSSGIQGKTSECIKRVNQIRLSDPNLGQSIDQLMTDSVSLAKQALQEHTAQSLNQLKQAIHIAHSCFEQWDLIPEPLHVHINQLRQAGALAIKPTGSGGGGFVLSLWESQPTIQDISLIRV